MVVSYGSLRALYRRCRLVPPFARTEVIPLSPKIIDLLLYLVARPSALRSEGRAFKALWPDVAVTDNALTQAVSELRQALGDDPSNHLLSQTVAQPGLSLHRTRRCRHASDRRHRVRTTALPEAASGHRGLDFTNVTGDKEFAWLSSGISERSRTISARCAELRVIDRMLVVETVRRNGWRPVGPSGRPASRSCRRRQFQRAGDVFGSPRGSWTRRRGGSRGSQGGWPAAQVFELQDRSSRSSPRHAGNRAAPPPRSPRAHRETSSLEAYQAFTEGRVGSSRSTHRSCPARSPILNARSCWIRVMRSRTSASANARFFSVQMSRARNRPDAALLARAIDHVRRAIELERDLAEAHATLLIPSRSAPGASATRGRRRDAPSRSSPVSGATSSGSLTRSGEKTGCARSRARWTSIPTFRSRISKRRWCTSPAGRSTAPNRFCGKARPSRIARPTSSNGTRRRGSLAAWPCPARPAATPTEARRSSSAKSPSGRSSSMRRSSR